MGCAAQLFTKKVLLIKKSLPKRQALGDSAEARTQDPRLKRALLYQLSYGIKKNRYLNKNGDPAEARTQDPRLKRALLYQLSYGIIAFAKCGCKSRIFGLNIQTLYRVKKDFPGNRLAVNLFIRFRLFPGG